MTRRWVATRDAVPDGYVQSTIYEDEEGNRVATVFGSEKNVELVRSAPEMYDALQEIGNLISTGYDDMHGGSDELLDMLHSIARQAAPTC